MSAARAALAASLLGLASLPLHAAGIALPREGWASWEVPAVEGAPATCCWEGWSGGDLQRRACKLDEISGGQNTRNNETTDSVKVYARSTGGKLDRLRVLTANCPVETSTPIQELNGVSADQSAGWLIAQLQQGSADAPRR